MHMSAACHCRYCDIQILHSVEDYSVWFTNVFCSKFSMWFENRHFFLSTSITDKTDYLDGMAFGNDDFLLSKGDRSQIVRSVLHQIH